MLSHKLREKPHGAAAVQVDCNNEVGIITRKSLEWYLEGYKNEPDRYDWGYIDEMA
jgi:hypothetical protein